MVERLSGCPVVVEIEPSHPAKPDFRALKAFRARHPKCPLITHVNDRGFQCPEWVKSEDGLVTIWRQGEHASPRVVRLALLRRADYGETARFLARCRKNTPAEAHLLLAAVLHGSLERHSVEQLAKTVGTTARTLGRRCQALGLPTPRRMLTLAVVYHIERLARWANRPRASAALAVGFSSPSAYRRMLQRALGTTPTALDQRGGPDHVAEVMLRECECP